MDLCVRISNSEHRQHAMAMAIAILCSILIVLPS